MFCQVKAKNKAVILEDKGSYTFLRDLTLTPFKTQWKLTHNCLCSVEAVRDLGVTGPHTALWSQGPVSQDTMSSHHCLNHLWCVIHELQAHRELCTENI